MRLLVDPSIFAYGRCGMTRYYACVCRGLKKRGVSIRLPLIYSRVNFEVKSTRIAKFLSALAKPFSWIPVAPRLCDLVSKYLFFVHVCRGNYDLVLVTSPSFSDRFLRYREDVPFAIVVHDTMTSVTVPDALIDSCGPSHQRLLYLTTRARVVICISETTREDLLAFAPLDKSRVATVLSGNMLQPEAEACQKDLPLRFLLFVGERSGRKGFDLLVRSMPAIVAAHPDVKLIVTGTLSRWELDFLCRWGLKDAVMSIAADDSTLQALYRQAICLVYPSLYEGFGLPPLEAMSLGCPVIAARVPAICEVCGDAALLIPPLDQRALESSILRILEEPELSEQLRSASIVRAGQFTLGRMMDEMNDILRKAIPT